MKKLLMLVPSPILAAILVLDLLLVTGIGMKNWGEKVPSNKATQVAENVTDAVLDKTGAADKVGGSSNGSNRVINHLHKITLQCKKNQLSLFILRNAK